MKLFNLSALFTVVSVVLAATIPRGDDSVQPAEGLDQGTSWLCYRGCLPAYQTCLWVRNCLFHALSLYAQTTVTNS
jgi:hypothetical protein